MLVVFPRQDHMLEKIRKARYAAFNEAARDAGSRPDLPRSAANRSRADPHPGPVPRLGALRYEAEIALRDAHSLAVCGQIRDAIPLHGQCVTSIPKPVPDLPPLAIYRRTSHAHPCRSPCNRASLADVMRHTDPCALRATSRGTGVTAEATFPAAA